MSSSTINQLFQLTSTSSSAGEASRADGGNGDLFRAHLERAEEVNEPKQSLVEKEDKPRAPESDDSLEPKTDQHETSDTQQEEPQAASDVKEKSESIDDTPSSEEDGDEAGDEVTLSAAAAAQPTAEASEVAATANLEIIAETSSAQDQQQGDQPAPELAQAAVSINGTQTSANAIENEIELLGEEGKANVADQTNQSSSDAEGDSEQAAAKQAILNGVQNASAAGEQGQEQQAVEVAAQQKASKQAQSVTSDEQLSEEGELDRGESRQVKNTLNTIATPLTTATAAIDSELSEAAKNLNVPESNSATANVATNPSGSENLAGAQRSLGGALTAAKATNPINSASGQETTEAPTVDRARFVQRVGGAIRTAQQRDGRIQLRLSPPELGTLRIQLTVSEGAITAHLETENAAARTVILDNLPALRERLAEQQITIEKFDVDVGREDQQQADYPDADESPNNERQRESSQANSQTNSRNIADGQEESSLTQSTVENGLDVSI